MAGGRTAQGLRFLARVLLRQLGGRFGPLSLTAGQPRDGSAIARSGKLGAELLGSPPWEEPQGAASTSFPVWLTAVGERHDERLRRRLGAAGSRESMVPGWGDAFGVAGGASYVVAQDGSGQYSSISEALAQVPFQNVERVVITVKPGVYKEKVVVPWSAPYVTLQGSGAGSTIISWSDYAGEIVDGQPITTFLSCTLCVDADHFIASGLVIRECTLRTKGTGWGTITAQNRNSPSLPTGFVFLRCNVSGVNEVYLGRAWGAASRVVFAYTFFDTILQPGGWSSWMYSDDTAAIFYGVYNCWGPTVEQAVKERASFSYSLTDDQAAPFLTYAFIGADGWLGGLPPAASDLYPLASYTPPPFAVPPPPLLGDGDVLVPSPTSPSLPPPQIQPPMASTTAIVDGPPAVAVPPAPVPVTKYMQRQQAHAVMVRRFNDRQRQAAVRLRAWRVKRRAHIARGHKYRLRHRRSLRV
eukprot:SM000026S08943  [mRNA]  locus=s26:657871:661317:- [translate_table: standard]